MNRKKLFKVAGTVWFFLMMGVAALFINWSAYAHQHGHLILTQTFVIRFLVVNTIAGIISFMWFLNTFNKTYGMRPQAFIVCILFGSICLWAFVAAYGWHYCADRSKA